METIIKTRIIGLTPSVALVKQLKMGKVETISIHGVELIFWSHDHDPPHLHAKKAGEWACRVYLMEAEENILEMEWENKAISGKIRRELTKLAMNNRDALLLEWEAKVSQS